jgi:peptidoglycan/LPS O-acetylase OafA/YrhL
MSDNFASPTLRPWSATAMPPGPLSILRSQNHIPCLDGIRGISAFLVVLAHIGILPDQFGSLGVAIFFVLSGFLITWLMLRESEMTGDVSLKKFYMRRTLRIFPAFYAYWFACVASFWAMGYAIQKEEVLSSFFYMGDYYNALKAAWFPQVIGIMGITWSLGVEEKFYLMWPVLFRWMRRRPQQLQLLCLAVILVVWLYRSIAIVWFQPPFYYLRYSFESRLDNIMFGCLLAITVYTGRDYGVLKRICNRPYLPFISSGVLVISVLVEEHFRRSTHDWYHYIVGMPMDAILIVCLLAQLLFLSKARPLPWLNGPVARFGGKISYSIYLFHSLVIAAIQHLLPALRLRLLWPLCIALTALAGTCSYYFIELPFLHLKGRFSVAYRAEAPSVIAAVVPQTGFWGSTESAASAERIRLAKLNQQ